MESALISMVSVALVIVASVTMMMSSFTSITSIMESWQEMEKKAELIRRTEISIRPPENYNGGVVDVYIENEGETNLSLFDKWDVIVRHQTGGVSYIEYTENPVPGPNQWRLEGLFLTDNTSISEIFDYNILNPGESARLNINISPEIEPGEAWLITASTSNGVASQCMVSR